MIDWLDPRTHPVIFAGVATFFFGFGAGALLNLYLIAVRSPLVAELRGTLTFKSSIFGDGILLPLVNMLVVWSLVEHRALVTQEALAIGLALGVAVTAYFHIVQAVRGLVNWTMPEPWHWNVLGVWHALYMFAVASLLSLFYVAVAASVLQGAPMLWEAALVTGGIALFFLLLRWDYEAVSLSALVPRRLARVFAGKQGSQP